MEQKSQELQPHAKFINGKQQQITEPKQQNFEVFAYFSSVQKSSHFKQSATEASLWKFCEAAGISNCKLVASGDHCYIG